MPTQPNNAKGRYETMFACEDRQLIMDCEFGSKINLIRANFGRFSLTRCNEQGQLDLSIDCMSPITFRIMKETCEDKQKCSINATSSIFGDKCPKTRKYLEVHFQCVQDASMSQIERVDLRTLQPNSQQQQQQPSVPNGFLYPSSLDTRSGAASSVLLPPNYPPNNQQQQQQQSFPTSNHQQQQQQSSQAQQDQLAGELASVSPMSSRHHPNTFNTKPAQQQPQQQQQQPAMTVINSEIVSYNAISDPRSSTSLSASGEFVVALRHLHTDNMSNPRCVLWDPIASQWTQQGSQLIETNQTHTICAFDQATSYLIVMDYSTPFQTVSRMENFCFVCGGRGEISLFDAGAPPMATARKYSKCDLAAQKAEPEPEPEPNFD